MARDYFADEPMPSLMAFNNNSAPVKEQQQGRVGDTVDAFQGGVLSGLGGIFDFAGAEGIAQSLYGYADDQNAQMSDRGREAMGQSFVQEDDQGNLELGEGATDLDTWLLTMVNVAGQFASTAVPGAGAAGAVVKAAKLGSKGKSVANAVSMGGTGGAAATGQGMEQARQEVANMPDNVLAESPIFIEVFRGIHASKPELSNDQKWDAAKKALSDRVAQEVRTDPKVLLANFAASAIADPIIGKALTGARIAKGGIRKSAATGFITEGATESVQAGIQQYGINEALQPIDGRDEMKGVVVAGLNEGLAGGGFGGAAGIVGGAINRKSNPITKPEQEHIPDPTTEKVKETNSTLGEAMESMDKHSANVKNEVQNLDVPTVARNAGVNNNVEDGKFGDHFTGPTQESLKTMRTQTVSDMINEASNYIGPTPQDREVITGDALPPEQSTDLAIKPNEIAIDGGFIDGELDQKQIEDKNIIFANDNINVAGNSKPFKSEKEARSSKSARQAKRKGLGVDVVPVDNGFGWKAIPQQIEPEIKSTEQPEVTSIPKAEEKLPLQPEPSELENNQVTPSDDIKGEIIDQEWQSFTDESETKKIPRSEMPQIKAENRGAMVNFMNARDISHVKDEVQADTLKPTQQEFSPEKVKKAMEFEGGDRSILVSQDGYVLDGHHQWMAAREKGGKVKVIRLDAPIETLVPLAKEMPSTETQDNSVPVKKENVSKPSEEDLPTILTMTKKRWLNEQAKANQLKTGSPGYKNAIGRIENTYDDKLDDAYASLPFEKYNELNSETPENLNRQAYDALREDLGYATVQSNDNVESSPRKPEETEKIKEPPKPKVKPNKPPKSGFSLPEENIEDFGEKLGGARKDTWGGFAEKLDDNTDIKTDPLSKSLPHPDYEKMAAEGVEPEHLAFIAIARDSIKSKPRANYKLGAWVKHVESVKHQIKQVLNNETDTRKALSALSLSSSYGSLNGAKDAIKVIAKASPSKLKDVAGYRITSGQYSVYQGVEYNPSKVMFNIEKKGTRFNFDAATETLAEAQEALAKIINIENESTTKKGKHSKISVYRNRLTGDTYLGWKGASGILKIKTFDSTNEARSYLENNRDEVEETLQKMKATPNMRKPINTERSGPERIADNVTPAIFGETFGFRGVEFGNWVEQGKRQKDLNQAYDSLMDLAEALDIPPEALSLNGQLGLAFGARGKGGKEPAAAHYESGTVVINLTKKAGSGSLAHEWWHALDNYFGKKRNKTDYITESPYSLPNEEIRAEMAKAFKAVRDTINASDLPDRSRRLDQRRSKAYWATTIEMTARSFETFIIDKLSKSDISNDYLANVIGDEAWEAAEALGFEDDSTYPYPKPQEQEQINAAYQTLFDTIQHKKTDEGTMLFSKSTVKDNAKGMSAKQAQSIADKFIESLNGANGLNVKIIQSNSEAEKLWRMSFDGSTVKGAYSDKSKTVYVIADNVDGIKDLKQTLAHETIAHGGLDTVIGEKDKKAFIDRIKATKGRKAFNKYWDDVNKDYSDVSEDVKAEEIFARFVENQPTKGELKYWWNAFKNWLSSKLEAVGFGFVDGDIAAMNDMLNAIVEGFNSGKSESNQDNDNILFSKTADTRTAKEKLGLEDSVEETFIEHQKQKAKDTINTLKSDSFWQRLNEGIFDGLAGIKQAEDDVGITDPNKQGYVSARLASGLADVLHGVFNYGAPQWKDGVVQRKEGTKGLLEVFGGLGDDLNDWLAWMGAQRAEKLKKEGRENNLSQSDINELKALAKGKEKQFEAARKEYNKINSAIIDLAQEAGLLSAEQRASFDEEYYVPFFRDMGESDSEMDDIKRIIIEPHTRKGIASQTAQIKELKGGSQSTKDLLENIISRQSTFIDAALKNKAMIEVTDNLDGTDYMQAETSEDIAKLNQQELNKLHRVKVMRNGKAHAYLVSDPSLLRALIHINDIGSKSLFNKFGRSAKRFLTAGITLSPDFIFKNFVRDAAHAWMVNKDGFKLGTDSMKGLKKAFAEDEAYRDLIFSGAAFQGGYIHGADPEAGTQQIRRALKAKGLSGKEVTGYLNSMVTTGAELIEKYRGMSDKLENANRLSAYEAALASGKSKRQAAFEAKDLMDYSLKGNFALINTMIDMLPFFNARLQGMSKLVRASKAGDNDRVLKVLSANLAMKGMKVAAFSLALAALNDEEDEYQELPDWDKDANWHFFVDGDHFRIPKPFELGIVFGTMPERLLHYGTGSQSGGDVGKSVANAVFNTLALNPIPQLALPVAEAMVNKSFFRDSPIEGMSDENKLAQDRYSNYTSELSKTLGAALNYSPKKIDHLIKGYTGTIGGYILGASDIVAHQMMGVHDASTPINRYPVIKSFYQGDTPKSSTKFANDFYKALEMTSQAYGSYKLAMEEGDTEKQKELIESEGEKLRSRISLNRIQRATSKLSKQSKVVNNNPNLSSKQKRDQLDEIQRQKNALYHQAYVTFNLDEW